MKDSLRYKNLLDAARGVPLGGSRKMRCFPLYKRNLRPYLPSPTDFHQTLCRLIRSAKHRVYVASLYIGPAAATSMLRERELLDALASTRAKDVQILLDRNRALRPVPMEQQSSTTTTSITSAQSCYDALQTHRTFNNQPQIFLLSVLPWLQQRWLPNPLNEVAGVFHLKCYVIDQDLLLTGANLSEEYFRDRADRYLWITDDDEDGNDVDVNGLHAYSTGNTTTASTTPNSTSSLVNCYAEIVQALCRHAQPYQPLSLLTNKSTEMHRTTRNELLNELTEILTVEVSAVDPLTHLDDKDIAAYAIPTLQTPPSFFKGCNNTVPADNDIVASLVQSASSSDIRIASAYLNPTDQLIQSLLLAQQHSNHDNNTMPSPQVHLLSAGLTSHGFKSNQNKPGNKGKSWIPAIYDTQSRRALQRLQQHNTDTFAHLWYYVRHQWTFHCKGLWISRSLSSSPQYQIGTNKKEISDSATINAVVTGSGNFGYRSSIRDLESNVILIFPRTSSSLQDIFRHEWNELCRYTKPVSEEPVQPLAGYLLALLPVLRYFF